MLKGVFQCLQGDCLEVEASTLNFTLLHEESRDVFNWLCWAENDILALK